MNNFPVTIDEDVTVFSCTSCHEKGKTIVQESKLDHFPVILETYVKIYE